MKHLILTVALALLPAAAMAQDAPAADPAAAPAAAPAALPKCTAKVQDSCDQSKTTERNALDHYPADTRDAGNNKIGAPAMARPMHKMAAHKKHRHMAHKAMTTTTTTTEVPAK